jgi:hypothetical protein
VHRESAAVTHEKTQRENEIELAVESRSGIAEVGRDERDVRQTHGLLSLSREGDLTSGSVDTDKLGMAAKESQATGFATIGPAAELKDPICCSGTRGPPCSIEASASRSGAVHSIGRQR